MKIFSFIGFICPKPHSHDRTDNFPVKQIKKSGKTWKPVKFEVLMAVTMKIAIFRDVKLYSLLDI
jgi:hypothetical protein